MREQAVEAVCYNEASEQVHAPEQFEVTRAGRVLPDGHEEAGQRRQQAEEVGRRLAAHPAIPDPSARRPARPGAKKYSPPRVVTNEGSGDRNRGGLPWIVIFPCGSSLAISRSFSDPRPNGSPSFSQRDWMSSNWRSMLAWKQMNISPRSSSSGTFGSAGGSP